VRVTARVRLRLRVRVRVRLSVRVRLRLRLRLGVRVRVRVRVHLLGQQRHHLDPAEARLPLVGRVEGREAHQPVRAMLGAQRAVREVTLVRVRVRVRARVRVRVGVGVRVLTSMVSVALLMPASSPAVSSVTRARCARQGGRRARVSSRHV